MPATTALPTPLRETLSEIEATDGVTETREALLLWILRDRFGISESDSYECIMPGDFTVNLGGKRVNLDAVGIYESSNGPHGVLCAYFEAEPLARIKASEYARIEDISRLARVISGRRSAQLANILPPNIANIVSSNVDGQTVIPSWTVIAITVGEWSAQAVNKFQSLSTKDAPIDAWDAPRINTHIKTETNPSPKDITLDIPVQKQGIIWTRAGESNVAVAPIPLADIATWDGIEDGSLFDLNIRASLGANKVSRSLDNALQHEGDSELFIAGHNGITVLCDELELITSPDGAESSTLHVSGISVVNGAQTVSALYRNNSPERPLAGKIIVKFVEGTDPRLATDIAVRSNTQNPVTSRNLKALDEVQLRLQKELKEHGFEYVVKQGHRSSKAATQIQNDEAAQLICAIFLREPWLAVKRDVLFSTDVYDRVFPANLSVARIIGAHVIEQETAALREEFDERYRRAWRLTLLTAVFLVGEALRSSDGYRQTLLSTDLSSHNPDTEKWRAVVRDAARLVTRYLNSLPDDEPFRVTFKRKARLQEMATEVSFRAQKQDLPEGQNHA